MIGTDVYGVFAFKAEGEDLRRIVFFEDIVFAVEDVPRQFGKRVAVDRALIDDADGDGARGDGECARLKDDGIVCKRIGIKGGGNVDCVAFVIDAPAAAGDIAAFAVAAFAAVGDGDVCRREHFFDGFAVLQPCGREGVCDIAFAVDDGRRR